MAIRSDLTVDWEVSPRIITVAAPSTTITIQDLHDTCRDIEDNLPEALEFAKLIDSAGKEPLGGGAFVGITATLQNAKLAFEARPGPTFVSCTVNGGNLVAVDANGDNMDPIQVTDYTQVTISQSSSPTIATPESDYNLLYLVESLRGKHATLGNVYYWDPVNGNDANAGTQPTTAVATFAQAQSLATAGNNDIIFCLSNHSSGITTVTETLNITVDTLKVRGPGFPFQIVPPSSGSDTISISADSVEVSGLYVETAGSGTDNGITVSGNNNLIKDCWISNIQGNGIRIANSARTAIKTSAIEHCGLSGTGDGISLGDNSTQTSIENCIVFDSVNGATLTGTGLADNVFDENLIYKNSAYGIDIGSGVLRTVVHGGHTFTGNTSGDTRDQGSATFIETPSGGASASSIADAVWDELVTDHLAAGSTGKTLSDAKSKATLASLK